MATHSYRKLASCALAALFASSAVHTVVVAAGNSTLKIIAPVQQRQAVASDLVIRPIAKKATLPAPVLENRAAKKLPKAVRGDLRVVARASHKPAIPLTPLAPPEEVEEVQPVLLPEEPSQQAVIIEEEVIEEKVEEKVAPQVDPIRQCLLQANALSQQASSEAQHNQIILLCAKAVRLGAEDESRTFARQLAVWSLNRRGQLRGDQQEPELALADFEAALKIEPDHWRALHNRGVSRAQAGQFAEAFDDFDRVLQLNPQFAKAYSNRATLFVQAKNLNEAMTDFQRSIELDSTLVAGQIGLGRISHMLGRLEESLQHVSKAVELDPGNADILCSRADLRADMGQYGDAMVDYARAIDLDSECAHAYRNGAWLLATCPEEQFRDGENALLGAQRAIEFGYGDRHVALDTLAAALANLGQFEEAIEPLQEAIELAPWKARVAYRDRLRLYEEQTAFRTQPIGQVRQASHQEESR